MADEIVEKIINLLNEEKWTRATLKSYSMSNFQELDNILDNITEDEELDTIKESCDEHLTHTKNSIIALYLSGIIALKKQLVDDSNLMMLINIFSDNHKWNIVEFLCNRILIFGENKFALKTLADCYQNENEEEKLFQTWERLIKIDYEETTIVKALAEKEEAEGNLEKAIDYYKKAIHRYINKKLFSNVKSIWQKLIEYIPEEVDFFFHVDRKVAKTISAERASQLLEDLYAHFKKTEGWDESIEILKSILEYDSKNGWARKEITECYKEKFKDHSHLDEYLKLSNLNQSWRNVHDAIADFEKHISFDAGNYVSHRSWGVGRIKSIKDDVIIIDFVRKRDHSMSLKMAVNALNILAKDHIWVLKSIWAKDKLKSKIKTDITWALKIIIKSFNNAADMKKIKAVLVPSILTPGEWTSWSSEARKILKTDPAFGNLPDKLDQYVVREKPITVEEKLFNKFKAEKNFFNRLQTIRDFLIMFNPESDYFAEMFTYFTNFIKNVNSVDAHVISSFLFIREISKQYPFLNPDGSLKFKFLVEKISENLETVFSKIEDTEVKKDFLEQTRKSIKDWPNIFKRLFPFYLSRYIIDSFIETKNENMIGELVNNIFDHYKEYRDPFVWLAKNTEDLSLFEKFNISYEKVLIGMIHLLDISFREIANRKDATVNRRLNKQIQSYLFKDKRLEDYILNADEDSISRLYSLIDDVKDLDPSISIELRHKIIQKFPNFKFYGVSEKETVSRGGIIALAKSYQQKQKELKHILEVEVPQNSKEIGEAIAMGDLKENAEYKAGKEKQELLNLSVAKLKEEIERAQIFNPTAIDSSKVSFATKVTLFNKEKNKTEQYTILGPWESNPSKKIISYLSPLGNELLNKKKDDELVFNINDIKYNYVIKEIESANF